MSPPDDDRDEMMNRHELPPLDDRAVEALLAGRAVPGWEDLSTAVGILRRSAAGPAPTPRPELALMLEAGLQPVPAPTPVLRRVPWAVRLAAGVAVFTGVTLSAATANALPAPLQDAVADAVAALTPFQLPRPDRTLPAEDGADDDEPTIGPSAEPTASPVPRGDVRPQPVPTAAKTEGETGTKDADERTEDSTDDADERTGERTDGTGERTDDADERTDDSTDDADERTDVAPAPSAQRTPAPEESDATAGADEPEDEVEPAQPDGGHSDELAGSDD